MNDDVIYNVKKYENGKPFVETWMKDGKYHRDDGPAQIEYFRNGKVYIESWFKDGNKHRIGGPSATQYYANGTIRRCVWRVDGKYHRTDGPAIYHMNKEGKIELEWYLENTDLTKKANDIIKTFDLDENSQSWTVFDKILFKLLFVE